jgi:hypothetical protein
MSRLLIHVEGQTEEDFVNVVLRNYLVHAGYQSVSARIIGNARLRRLRGGIRPWPPVKKDIINHLRQDSGCLATTMVDYYGLPKEGNGAWPGRAEATHMEASEKAPHVQSALFGDLAGEIEADFNPDRFIPFVVMHEFEALLFSDCAAFADGIGRRDLEPALQSIRDSFESPEDINDSFVTSPSKRIESLVPGYEKPLFGILAVLEIGLDRIRAQCRHFDGWIESLEMRVR